jgi:RimJ/RimL family protein N-acetyltransferase
MDPQPITLAGRQVRLEPLTLRHVPELFAAVMMDPSVWQWLPVAPPASIAQMEAMVAADLDAQAKGAKVAFAQVEQATGRVVGGTTYLDIRRQDRGLEIGSTWIAKPWQRTGINTEAKYLLLRHAFEDLDAVRVQLKTDQRNLQSQAAIERLGAVREGILRKHMLVRDGFIRNTVLYSITSGEWPMVKVRLEAKLAAHEIQRQDGRGDD